MWPHLRSVQTSCGSCHQPCTTSQAWDKAQMLHSHKVAGTDHLSLTEYVGLAHSGPELRQEPLRHPRAQGSSPPLLPPPGALGKLSSSNLHCPSGLLITEPSGPTDLYSHHLPRAPQPPGVATPPVTILQMKTRGTWTVGQGMAWEPKLVRTVLLLPPSSSRCHPRPPGL